MNNSFGTLLRLTTFGESHGPAQGGILDGFPAGLKLDLERAQAFVDRRRPGSTSLGTPRREPDRVEWLSGFAPDGRTLGSPIGFIIRNTDTRPADYANLAEAYRPGHADYTWEQRYGVPAPSGGGRSSARETASRVAAGALCVQALEMRGVAVESRLLWPTEAEIEAARADADTIGAVVECTVTGVPAGVGSPVFGKLSARLAEAMMSIPAAKAFEVGMGVEGCRRRGSEVADPFAIDADGRVVTLANNSGGLQGGITNGMPIVMRVHFKPIASLPREQQTVTRSGEPTRLTVHGRHDPSVAARVRPVVESMAALTILEALLFA